MAQVTINNGDSGSTVRTALNGMFTELYGESNFPQVADYASLPTASSYSGITYEVLASTGAFLVNRKSAGLYRSNGTTWVYLGDINTDAATTGNTPAGNISATTVQDAINELDTEKATAGVITSSGLTMATGSLVYRKTASTGAVEVNTLATLKTDLGLTGTNGGDQTITLTGDVTGSGTGSFTATIPTSVISTFGRTLTDDADAATARATLGLGSIAVEAEATAAQIQAGTASKAVAADKLLAAAAPQTLTDGATITWDMSAGFNAKVTLGGNRTLTVSNPAVGMTYSLGVIQDGTGSRTLTWPAGFDWGSAGAPTLTTTASKRDRITLFCTDAATPKFDAFLSGKAFS